jgi:D-alanine transaminase/branched-chain amino acid aminotransferase
MIQWAFINDDFIADEKAVLSIRDMAIQRGYGIFDFFKVVNSLPLFLEDHLDRFFYSAKQMRLEAGKSREELQTIIIQLIQKNALPNCGIRITLTGGYSDDGYQIAKPNLIISLHLFQSPTPEQFEKGIALVSYEHQRQLPQVKTIDYLMAVWLQPYIKQQQADDVLYHQNGSITECPRCNLFIVTKDEKVITPSENVLKGITRKRILETPHFQTEERPISLQEVLEAKEVFISSTTKIILPVTAINGTFTGDGKPGLVTRKLYQSLF